MQARGVQGGPQQGDIEARILAEVERRVAELPIMAHSIDGQGRLLSVNEAWLAKLGYTRAQALGRPISEFLTSEAAERVRANLPDFFASGRCENLPLQMLGADGRVLDVLLSAVRIEGGEHGPVSQSVLVDITEFAETRRLLFESEARYRFLAEHSSDLILLIGANGRRIYASPASRKLLGYEPREAVALSLAEAIHPDDASRILPVLAAKPADTLLTYRMRHKDGGYVWVETTGNTVETPGGERQRLIIVRDIDKRVASEERLKASEARYRLLAENSSDMVFQLDRALVCEYVSPAVREILGVEPEAMVGQPPAEGIHRDDLPRLEVALDALLRGVADRLTVTLRMRHRDGRWVWLEAQVRAVKDAGTREVTGIIGALRDISARKAVEDELADANLRLQRLAGQDPLTGLANRRLFDEALAACARAEAAQLALVMIDVDGFKAFNDLYGHPAGDECLKRVARAIVRSLRRPADVAARYGGEEFAVLSLAPNEADALALATAIRDAVAGLQIPHKGAETGVVTVSAGVALTCGGGDAGEVNGRLLRDADRALYAAKNRGRNAVVLASTLETARWQAAG